MTTTPPEYLPAARLSDEQGKICVNFPCHKCGHSLDGVAFLDACPNCDVPAYHSAASTDTQFDEHGRLACDVPCRRCRYNLQAQPIDGACPECGLAVVHSTLINHLHFADPRWLQGIGNGIASVVITTGLATICLFFFGAVIAYRRDAPSVYVIYAVILGLVFGPGLAGVWQATSPDPNLGRTPAETRRARHVRIAALCASLPILIALLLEFLLVSIKWMPPRNDILIQVASAVQICAAPLFFYTFFKYLQWPMSRLPGRFLIANLRSAGRGMLIALGLSLSGFFIARLTEQQSIHDGIAKVFPIMILTMLAWTVFVFLHVTIASRGAAKRARNIRLLASRPPAPRVESPPTRHNHADDA